MANEITSGVSFNVSKGGAKLNGAIVKAVNMTGTNVATATQSVTTASFQALAVPASITYPASLAIINNDSANFVTVYKDSGGSHQISKLLAGQPMMLTNIAQVPYLKADTATCVIQFYAWEA